MNKGKDIGKGGKRYEGKDKGNDRGKDQGKARIVRTGKGQSG